jgi:hypothetical protein
VDLLRAANKPSADSKSRDLGAIHNLINSFITCYQPPEVNYIEVFENSDLPQDVYSQSRHPVEKHHSQTGVDSSLLVAGGDEKLFEAGEARASLRT